MGHYRQIIDATFFCTIYSTYAIISTRYGWVNEKSLLMLDAICERMASGATISLVFWAIGVGLVYITGYYVLKKTPNKVLEMEKDEFETLRQQTIEKARQEVDE